MGSIEPLSRLAAFADCCGPLSLPSPRRGEGGEARQARGAAASEWGEAGSTEPLSALGAFADCCGPLFFPLPGGERVAKRGSRASRVRGKPIVLRISQKSPWGRGQPAQRAAGAARSARGSSSDRRVRLPAAGSRSWRLSDPVAGDKGRRIARRERIAGRPIHRVVALRTSGLPRPGEAASIRTDMWRRAIRQPPQAVGPRSQDRHLPEPLQEPHRSSVAPQANSSHQQPRRKRCCMSRDRQRVGSGTPTLMDKICCVALVRCLFITL